MRITLQEPTDLDMLAESASEGGAAEGVAAEGVEEEFVHQEDAPLGSPEDSQVVANNINTFLQRVSGFSVAEIDRQIMELRNLREELQSEGERIQREITQYAHLSRSARQSTKIITETLVKPKLDSA